MQTGAWVVCENFKWSECRDGELAHTIESCKTSVDHRMANITHQPLQHSGWSCEEELVTASPTSNSNIYKQWFMFFYSFECLLKVHWEVVNVSLLDSFPNVYGTSLLVLDKHPPKLLPFTCTVHTGEWVSVLFCSFEDLIWHGGKHRTLQFFTTLIFVKTCTKRVQAFHVYM